MGNNIKRLDVLDCMRGIAAIFVVFFHYSKFSDNEIGKLFFSWGYTGVYLFFIISGFVIFMSVKKHTTWVEFVKKRFIRLYPTFWFCMVLTAVLVYVFGLSGREVSFNDFLINFTMIPKVFGAKLVDGVYWTLLYELFFYILIAILIFFKVIEKFYLWLGIWLILCLLNNTFSVIPQPLGHLLNLYFGNFFIAGILFYKLKFGKLSDWKIHLLVLATFIVYLCSYKDLKELIAVTIYYVVFYLFIFDKLLWLKSKVLVQLGFMSYALYLLHQNIGYIIIEKLDGHIDYQSLWIILIPFGFSLMLSYIVFRYVEKPLVSQFKKRLS